MSKEQKIHQKISQHGVRIFAVRIMSTYGRDYELWMHENKTVEEWRADVRNFIKDEYASSNGWAEDKVLNSFSRYLNKLGYVEALDVAADVFEGRVNNVRAQIVDHPDHDEQTDGFGHFGWESKPKPTYEQAEPGNTQ